MKRRTRLAALLGAALAVMPLTLESQEGEPGATEATEGTEAPEPAAPALPIPLSITASGGVSLGGYQAGFLYYLTEVIKLNPQLFQPKILTGSSAGTINSIIALIALGNPPEPDPRKSLFYSSWTTLRYDDLIDVDNAPPLALSSRRAMEKMSKQLEDEWVEGFDGSLDIVVGAAATRVVGRSVGIGEGLDVPRQEEKFVFRVRGRGKGAAPLVTNYVDQTWGVEQPLLPFAEPNVSSARSAAADFAVVKQIMFASSAFPLAFPPQKVGFCMTSPEIRDPEYLAAFRDCPEPRYKTDFVDGSMFDRNPIGLAHRTARAGLFDGGDASPGAQWRPMPDLRNGTLPEDVLFLYLDSERTSYPEPIREKSTKHIESLIPAFGAYSQEYVRAAQAKELYTLVDENPLIRDRLEITFRDLPSASGFLFNFFGFFDRQFRVFDFYLGMHDARRYVLETIAPRVWKAAGEEVEIALPEDSVGRRGADSWGPFFCLRGVVDGDAKYQGACMARDLEDFRILLQVALDRLYDQCRALEPDETIDHLHCKRAMDKEDPPRVHGPRPDDDEDNWKRLPDETSFQHMLRLLEEYDFWFRDLGLDRDESWLAMSAIREQLAGDLDALVKKLPRRERMILRTFGKPALNFFKYQPPQAIVYLAAGMGTEVGTSLTSRFVPTRWVRFNLALQTRGLSQLISPAKNVWAFTPLLGLEFEIPQLSDAVFQFRLGARVGFQFSTGDRFLQRDCDLGDFDDDAAQCSAPLGQALVVFSFYERIRIQGGLEWFPYFFSPMSERNENAWNGFIEVGWQWISPF